MQVRPARHGTGDRLGQAYDALEVQGEVLVEVA